MAEANTAPVSFLLKRRRRLIGVTSHSYKNIFKEKVGTF